MAFVPDAVARPCPILVVAVLHELVSSLALAVAAVARGPAVGHGGLPLVGGPAGVGASSAVACRTRLD